MRTLYSNKPPSPASNTSPPRSQDRDSPTLQHLRTSNTDLPWVVLPAVNVLGPSPPGGFADTETIGDINAWG